MLRRYPEAEVLYNDGLKAAVNGEFYDAYEMFSNSRDALLEAHSLRAESTLSLIVQDARLVSDCAVTYLKEDLASSDPDSLQISRELLGGSLKITAKIVSGSEFLIPKSPETTKAFVKARGEVFSEHGKTLSWLGQTATIGQIETGNGIEDNRDGANMGSDAELLYDLAHVYLLAGNNGHYRVNNALAAARHEYLSGRSPFHMAKWLGRAAYGLAWTALHDRPHFKVALIEIGADVRHLPKHETVQQTVLNSPSRYLAALISSGEPQSV